MQVKESCNGISLDMPTRDNSVLDWIFLDIPALYLKDNPGYHDPNFCQVWNRWPRLCSLMHAQDSSRMLQSSAQSFGSAHGSFIIPRPLLPAERLRWASLARRSRPEQ